MSKVADLFNDCYSSNSKWEVIDFFIIGFFLFMGVMLLILFDDLACTMNNYYSDGCNKLVQIRIYLENLN